MEARTNYITPEGYFRLKARYDELYGSERPKLLETISWAAGNGDRSENGDYIYGRKRLREVPGLDVLDGPGVDPAKLVVLLAGTGAHGGLVEADLIDAGMPVEMGDRDTVVPIVTMADDEDQIATFTEELIAAVERHRGQPRRPVATAAWTVRPQPVLAPREAFFALNETVPASSAVGRISAELVAPYPPGVPVLAPGELITAEALAALREVAGYGGRIAYAEDPSLATFQVVA